MRKEILEFYSRYAPVDEGRIYFVTEDDKDTFYYLGGSYYYWPHGEEVICLAEYRSVIPDLPMPEECKVDGELRNIKSVKKTLTWLYPKVRHILTEKFIAI